MTDLTTIGIRPNPLPTNLVAGLGDSLINGGYGAQGAYGSRTANGMVTWVEAACRGRVRMPATLNFGVSGQASGTILARTPTAIAAMKAAGVYTCIASVGRNDPSGWIAGTYDVAQTLSNLAAIEALFVAAGINLIWLTPPPAGDAAFPGTNAPPANPSLDTANMLPRYMAMQRWFLSRTAPGVFVADAFTEWATQTYADSVKGWAATGQLQDGTHPTALGWLRAAVNRIAPILTTIYPEVRRPLARNAADVWSATSPDGQRFANPTMLGTGGGLNGNSGVVPDAWNAGGSIPSGLTAVYSKETRRGKEAVKVVYSGTAPSGTPTHNAIQRDQSYAGAGISAGQEFALSCEIEQDAGALGVYQVDPCLSVSTTFWHSSEGAQTYGQPLEAWGPLLFVTDPWALPATGPVRGAVRVSFVPLATVSLTLWIWLMDLR